MLTREGIAAVEHIARGAGNMLVRGGRAPASVIEACVEAAEDAIRERCCDPRLYKIEAALVTAKDGSTWANTYVTEKDAVTALGEVA